MLRFPRLVFLLCLLVAVAFTATAQDTDINLTETLEFEDPSLQIDYPTGWDTEEIESYAAVIFSEEVGVFVEIVLSLDEESDIGVTMENSPAEFLQATFNLFYDIELASEEIETSEDGDLVIAEVLYSEDNHSYVILNTRYDIIYFANAFSVDSESGEPTEFTDEKLAYVVAVVTSVRPIDADPEGSKTAHTSGEENTSASDENAATDNTADTSEDTASADEATCIVTVTEPDTVRLRVLPGPNRRIIKLLEVGEYTVIDRTIGPAGNRWFRLDKDEAAPRSPAEETWVAAARVEVGDGCAPRATDNTRVTAANAGACIVTADNSRITQVRVGPGRGRTSVGVLQPGEYQPIARQQIENGSVWFQLDKDETMPGTSAAETWVAAAALPGVRGACNALPSGGE